MLHIGFISKNKNIELIRELNRGKDIQAFNIKNKENLNDKKIDILVLEDLIVDKDTLELAIKEISYLIMQDNINGIEFNLEDKEINVITFGFNHKSTVTVSSVTEESIAICIQRKIKNVYDKYIQPKESIIENENKYNINKQIIKKIIQELLEK